MFVHAWGIEGIRMHALWQNAVLSHLSYAAVL